MPRGSGSISVVAEEWCNNTVIVDSGQRRVSWGMVGALGLRKFRCRGSGLRGGW